MLGTKLGPLQEQQTILTEHSDPQSFAITLGKTFVHKTWQYTNILFSVKSVC